MNHDDRPGLSFVPPPNLAGTRLEDAARVAVLSFLFNWPSTGGGNMHTAGLVDFLGPRRVSRAALFARFSTLGDRPGLRTRCPR